MRPPKISARWTTEQLQQNVWKKVAWKNPNRASFTIFPAGLSAVAQILVSLDATGTNPISFLLAGAPANWPSFYNAKLPVGVDEVYITTATAGGGAAVICEETYADEN